MCTTFRKRDCCSQEVLSFSAVCCAFFKPCSSVGAEPRRLRLKSWKNEKRKSAKGTNICTCKADTAIHEMYTTARSFYCRAPGGSMTHLRLVLHFRCELRFWRRFRGPIMWSLFVQGGRPPVTRHWHHWCPRKKTGYAQRFVIYMLSTTCIVGRIKISDFRIFKLSCFVTSPKRAKREKDPISRIFCFRNWPPKRAKGCIFHRTEAIPGFGRPSQPHTL